MPREDRMFGSVVDPSKPIGGRQGASVLIATLVEAAIVAVLIALPLMAADVLPVPLQAMDAFVMASPPPPTPPPPAGRRAPKPSTPSPEPVMTAQPVSIPLEAPPGIVPEPPTDNSFEREGHTGGVPGSPGDIGGVVGGLEDAPPPPPPPPVPETHLVGGNILPPVKTRHVVPVYPAIAVAAGVEDVVIIEATIGVDGRVTDARILRGHTLLNDAALDAVRQWQFTPTLLNGVPIAVIMNVTVRFQLQ